jgi:hypothetical protein
MQRYLPYREQAILTDNHAYFLNLHKREKIAKPAIAGNFFEKNCGNFL